MKKRRTCFVVLSLSLGLASGTAGQLKEFTSLLSFAGTNGAEPWCKLIQAKDGLFYGTTYSGGTSGGGTVFSLLPTGTLYTLHNFSFSDGGYSPGAGLLQASDGNLYGTTTDGSGNSPGNNGVIFRISPGLPIRPITPALTVIPITFFGVFTNLYEFSGADGAHPWAGPLVQGRDGFLYGTTEAGGSDDLGSIFQISTNGNLNSLHSLNGTSGHTPYGGLAEGQDGNFYGITSVGAAGTWGTVFRVTPSGEYQDLFSFNGADGAIPFGGLVLAGDGTLYGTTSQGGPSYGDPNSVNGQGFGTIFKITTNGVLTTLFSFAGTNGSYPYGPLLLASDGKFYGTTLSGGSYTNYLFDGIVGYAGYGTLFSITTNGEFTSLYSFDKTNGSMPFGTPLQAADGSFYATTTFGGANDLGTVYHFRVSLPPSLGAPTMLTNECGRPDILFFDKITNYNETPLTAVWTVNQQTVETNILQPTPTVTFALFQHVAELPLGTNIVTLTVSDEDGDASSVSTIVKVVDTIPPVIATPIAFPSTLPPTGRMVNVEVVALLAESCQGATSRIISVDSPGIPLAKNGRMTYWQIINNNTVALLAERNPGGRERVYHITVQATDSSGHVSQPKVVTVTVPKALIGGPR